MTATRIGMIVPSSNTTMETELPALARARQAIRDEQFTFHASRMRMQQVSPEQLAAMDQQSVRCAEELGDAQMDALLYACLVGIMAQGHGYHRESERGLGDSAHAPVVTSAGALVTALQHLGVRKVSVIAPYLKPLTSMVCDYIAAEGVEVHDALSLEVDDNLAVGRLDPNHLIDLAEKVDLAGADALVLSACVQMPSLPAIQPVQDKLTIPVLSAATASMWQTLRTLRMDPVVPDAGWLLAEENV